MDAWATEKNLRKTAARIYGTATNEELLTTATKDRTTTWSDPLSRPDAVLIAQLRSGHCRKLAAYRSVVDANSSPTCPHCETDHETLEHWIQECPATAVKRIRVFGGRHPIYQSSGIKPEGCSGVRALTLVHVTPSCRRQQQQRRRCGRKVFGKRSRSGKVTNLRRA